jgi:RNA polymerase sigma factor (sigma-70 family)
MKIAAELRLKHGALWEACNAVGGAKALAEMVGIGISTVYGWLQMRKCPTPGRYTKHYTQQVEQSLEEITGLPASELFPVALKEATKYFAGNTVRVAVKEMTPEQLLAVAIDTDQRSITDDPRSVAELHELTDCINDALRFLPERERRIIEFRYKHSMTLDQTAKEFGVSRARIRALEAKAIRKLQEPSRAHALVEFADQEPQPNFHKLDEQFKRSQEMSLREFVGSK